MRCPVSNRCVSILAIDLRVWADRSHRPLGSASIAVAAHAIRSSSGLTALAVGCAEGDQARPQVFAPAEFDSVRRATARS